MGELDLGARSEKENGGHGEDGDAEQNDGPRQDGRGWGGLDRLHGRNRRRRGGGPSFARVFCVGTLKSVVDQAHTPIFPSSSRMASPTIL